MFDQEGPLQRIKQLGYRSVALSDLLAVAMSNSPEETLLQESKARLWLERFQLRGFADQSPADVRQFGGLDEFEAVRFLCVLEVGRKLGLAGMGEHAIINGPRDVVKMLEEFRHEKKEHFLALFLNAKNGVIGRTTIHIGTVNMSVVGAREVFREALRFGAASLIVAHNHPSGDPTPSTEDEEITIRLADVGEMLDIPLHDHIILGHHNYVSLKERGIL